MPLPLFPPISVPGAKINIGDFLMLVMCMWLCVCVYVVCMFTHATFMALKHVAEVSILLSVDKSKQLFVLRIE